MNLSGFWDEIDAQLNTLKTARTAEDVIRILGGEAAASSGDAFFAGGGGDGTVYDSLNAAGWDGIWYEAVYHWCMRAPDGTAITYVEGDIYRGNSRA